MPPPNFTPAQIGSVYDGYRYLRSGTWQRITPADAAAVPPPLNPGTQGNCPDGMVHVQGQMRLGVTTALQDQSCIRWLPGEPRRCAEFNVPRLERAYARLTQRRAMDFCMDRYEYPNIPGEYPAVGMTYNQAQTMCREQGREVCTDRQWIFACEGEESTPYATGYTRPTEECAIDRRWRNPSGFRRQPASSPRAATELGAIYQADRSGANPECVSSFGVYDQAGNADENLTRQGLTGPYRNVMMGGHWAGVRNRCRPATVAHNEGYRDYQLSFRCCAPTPQVPAQPFSQPAVPASFDSRLSAP